MENQNPETIEQKAPVEPSTTAVPFEGSQETGYYADFSGAELTPVPEAETQVVTPAEAVLKTADEALKEIRGRSFSGRHPELGKMVKCAVCGFRHRSSIVCKQKFVVKWIEEDVETGERTEFFATALPQPGEFPPRAETFKQKFGASIVKGRRIKPHPNRRNLIYIETVRAFTPDEFTPEELAAAHKRATNVLGLRERKSYGTKKFCKTQRKRQK